MPKVKLKLVSFVTQCGSFLPRLFQAVVCFIVLNSSQFAHGAAIEDLEAVFIGQFTNYVEWPASFDFKKNPNSSFIISVVGGCPVLQKLKQLSGTSAFKSRKVVIRSVNSAESLPKSAIVFICGEDSEARDDVIRKTKGLGTMTFSYAEGFAEKGIMVNFYLDDEKLRFEINEAVVKKEGLLMSSQLLKLARILQ